ncbi:Crp/Fnr family transcriptional regulator [Kitasatospora sp. NPDC091257]|uniref:Crp/Fnr family transcriptional regulator n=1 Tax=Kitasatospora sp. NPDC091257 TaxID=3364084 RepID=UPI00380E2D06
MRRVSSPSPATSRGVRAKRGEPGQSGGRQSPGRGFTAGPGGLLGEVAVLDDGVRSASVQAISDCTVVVVTKAAFLRFVAEHGLFPVLVRYAMSRLRESDLARTGGDVVPRLAAALVALADLSAGPVPTAGRRIELALTRDELAQHLGVSRNTVTAALVSLAAHRVEAGRKSIALDDLPALRRAAASLRD